MQQNQVKNVPQGTTNPSLVDSLTLKLGWGRPGYTHRITKMEPHPPTHPAFVAPNAPKSAPTDAKIAFEMITELLKNQKAQAV